MDLQLIVRQNTAQVSAVRSSSDGVLLAVVGAGFSNVLDVLVNGQSAAGFVVFSSTQLSVEVPSSQIGAPIRSVTVLTDASTSTGATVLDFKLSNRTQVSGALYTAQSFLMQLLASPGSDIFNPQAGGGLLAIIGLEGKAAKFRAEGAIRRTLAAMQSSSAANPAKVSEMVADVKLLGLQYDRPSSTLSIRLRVTTATGQVVELGTSLNAEAS